MPNKKMIFAHRGLFGGRIPENSLSAFQCAIDKGMGIELDIRLTKDGVPIVFHDKTLMRMCGEKRRVSRMTFEEIKNFRLGNSDEGIPKLSEVLELVNGQTPLLIETKHSRFFPCSHCLERSIIPLLRGYNGEYLLQSFNRWSVRFLKKKIPAAKCGILSGIIYPEPSGFDFVNYKMNGVTAEKIRELKQKYPLLIGWGNVTGNEENLDGLVI